MAIEDTLARLEALEREATGAPWSVRTRRGYVGYPAREPEDICDVVSSTGCPLIDVMACRPDKDCNWGDEAFLLPEDAAFIAASRTALPALLAVARAAHAYCRATQADPLAHVRQLGAYNALATALRALGEVAG